MVAIIDTQPAADPREEAYKALDEALGRGRVLRSSPGEAGSRRKYWIAFYNPFTGEVTAGRATDALVLGDGALLELPADGAPAVLARCGEDVTQHVEVRALTARTPTFAALTRALAAHQRSAPQLPGARQC